MRHKFNLYKLYNKSNRYSGYSLIELTIVIGLVSILSVAISAIVLATIVNSNRIKTQVRIRQTGDYAIGQIQTIVRNSRGVSSCATANQVTINNQDGNTTLLRLEGDRIASNSGIYLTPDDTEVTSFSLTCLPSAANPKLINVSFTMGKANATNEREIENPTQKFSTSIELRNE